MIFKCEQHPSILTEQLQTFYNQKSLFDTVLKTCSNDDSVIIQCHRFVLCAFSEYFLEIFCGDQAGLKGNVVELNDIEATNLKLIIDFMYSGSIDLNLETVEEILRIAFFLKMKSLIDGCCALLESNINSSNSLKWFRLANEHNLPSLKTKVIEHIYTNFQETSKEKELLLLNEDELKNLLFIDNPYGDFEESVFLAMVAWINYDKTNREHLVFQLLSMVPFQALTPKFIIENRKSVCKTIESYELICSWHLSPETRSDDQKNFVLKSKEIPKKLAFVEVNYEHTQINIKTFNPINNSWSIDKKIPFPSNMVCSSIVLIDDKLIVAVRIRNESYSRIKYLDQSTLEWFDLPQMKNDIGIELIADLNGNLCVIGYNENEQEHYVMEVYNFLTCRWYADILSFLPVYFTLYIATHKEMLYVMDSNKRTYQCYNASSNKWNFKELSFVCLNYYGVAAVEGFLYVFGIMKNKRDVKRYNLSDGSCCTVASIPYDCQTTTERLETTVFGNKIIISDSCHVNEYNIDTDEWKTLSSLKKTSSEVFHICYLTGFN